MGMAKHATDFCYLWGTGKTSWESKIFALPAFTFHRSDSSEEQPVGAGCFGEVTWVQRWMQQPQQRKHRIAASVWKALQHDPTLLWSSALPCWAAVWWWWWFCHVQACTGPLVCSCQCLQTGNQTAAHTAPWQCWSSVFEAAVQQFALLSILDVNWQSTMTPLCILVVQHSKQRCEMGRDFKKLLWQSLREGFKSNHTLFFQTVLPLYRS